MSASGFLAEAVRLSRESLMASATKSAINPMRTSGTTLRSEDFSHSFSQYEYKSGCSFPMVVSSPDWRGFHGVWSVVLLCWKRPEFRAARGFGADRRPHQPVYVQRGE